MGNLILNYNIMSKQGEFNHNDDLSVVEACGLTEAIEAKYEAFVGGLNEKVDNGGIKVSIMVEAMEKEFTPREIAFIATQKILDESHQEAMRENPLEAFAKMLANKRRG